MAVSAEAVEKFLSENPSFAEEWILSNRGKGLSSEEDKKEEVVDVQKHVSTTPPPSPIPAVETAGRNRTSVPSQHSDDDYTPMEEASFRSVVPRTARKSVTRDLFHQWLTSPRGSGGGATLSPAAAAAATRGGQVRATPAELLEQNDQLMELILDISNELNIDVLCHKILLNIKHLTKADRCSLFLARGPRENRYLEAKLFDVEASEDLEDPVALSRKEEIHIPFGVGICGQVAKTKEPIVLKNAYKDPRFNPKVDGQAGYRTNSLVAMPVCNYEGEVISVAQIINKKANGASEEEFGEADIKIFERYLAFCGVSIQNAQLFEVSILEYKKNQLLLSLARNLFQEQMSLERLVSTIITEAKEMLNCERCTVYLLDLRMYDEMEMDFFHHPTISTTTTNQVLSPKPPSTTSSSVGGSEFIFPTSSSNNEMEKESRDSDSLGSRKMAAEASTTCFQHAWELQADKSMRVYGHNDREFRQARRAKIAKYVAVTKEVLNLSNVADWLGEAPFLEKDGFHPVNMVSVPIFNGQRDVIGVAQLINKKSEQRFTESDISLFEAFAIFCGIGIHNTKMYEGACKLTAKQKVALDCLSYHASASDGDTDSLAKSNIPEAKSCQLDSYKFNDLEMTDEDTFKVTIRMFMDFGLIQNFQIPYRVLCRWILSVKKNYRPVKYHNWRHALNVCQTMFTVLKTGKMDRFMNDLEIFGLLVACLCHDLDHRGTNNAFQTKMDSPLALLYSTSTMEHHHFDQCVMILSSEGNNIFQGLSTDDYRQVMKVVEQAILSTDLALYFRKKDLFLETANKGEIDWQECDKKDLLCGMLMTACDVSAIAKPWELQHRLAKRVADEFFDQGDMEKLRLNQQPIAMMDRERKDELPKMQVGFIDVVCKPLYTSLSESFPWIKPLLDGCLANREKWADLAEKVEMGLTWIDHDTIDKPIEELEAGTAEAKDIEFTVETLKSNSSSSTGSHCTRRDSVGSKKRSLRSAKSPVSGRASGFFTRRLSAKSPRMPRAAAIAARQHEVMTSASLNHHKRLNAEEDETPEECVDAVSSNTNSTSSAASCISSEEQLGKVFKRGMNKARNKVRNEL